MVVEVVGGVDLAVLDEACSGVDLAVLDEACSEKKTIQFISDLKLSDYKTIYE